MRGGERRDLADLQRGLRQLLGDHRDEVVGFDLRVEGHLGVVGDVGLEGEQRVGELLVRLLDVLDRGLCGRGFHRCPLLLQHLPLVVDVQFHALRGVDGVEFGHLRVDDVVELLQPRGIDVVALRVLHGEELVYGQVGGDLGERHHVGHAEPFAFGEFHGRRQLAHQVDQQQHEGDGEQHAHQREGLREVQPAEQAL